MDRGRGAHIRDLVARLYEVAHQEVGRALTNRAGDHLSLLVGPGIAVRFGEGYRVHHGTDPVSGQLAVKLHEGEPQGHGCGRARTNLLLQGVRVQVDEARSDEAGDPEDILAAQRGSGLEDGSDSSVLDDKATLRDHTIGGDDVGPSQDDASSRHVPLAPCGL